MFEVLEAHFPSQAHLLDSNGVGLWQHLTNPRRLCVVHFLESVEWCRTKGVHRQPDFTGRSHRSEPVPVQKARSWCQGISCGCNALLWISQKRASTSDRIARERAPFCLIACFQTLVGYSFTVTMPTISRSWARFSETATPLGNSCST